MSKPKAYRQKPATPAKAAPTPDAIVLARELARLRIEILYGTATALELVRTLDLAARELVRLSCAEEMPF